jgi:hypothetical protein
MHEHGASGGPPVKSQYDLASTTGTSDTSDASSTETQLHDDAQLDYAGLHNAKIKGQLDERVVNLEAQLAALIAAQAPADVGVDELGCWYAAFDGKLSDPMPNDGQLDEGFTCCENAAGQRSQRIEHLRTTCDSLLLSASGLSPDGDEILPIALKFEAASAEVNQLCVQQREDAANEITQYGHLLVWARGVFDALVCPTPMI